MARDTTFNNPVRQVIQTNEDQHKYDLPTFRRMEVNAQARNQFVEPAANDAMLLANSLAAASPGLTTWLATKNRESDDADVQKGMQARDAAGDITDEQARELAKVSSPGYQKGYMRLHGLNAGKEDAARMQMDWQSDGKRNDQTTDDWIKNWYAKNSKGLDDPDFLSTYNLEVIKEANKLRNIGREEKITEVTQATEGAVIKYFMDKMRANEFTRDSFEQSATDASNIFKISKSKTDDLALAAVNQLLNDNDNPNPEIVKRALRVFKEDKSDGTPGLAFKGKFAQDATIDRMMLHADQVAISTIQAGDDAARKAREKEREEGMRQVWEEILVNNNPQKGRAIAISLIKNNPKLFDSKDILSTMSAVNSQQHRVETTGMQAKNIEYLGRALEGDLTIQDVADGVKNGKISYGTAPSLISAIKSYRAEDNALFKTPDFQAAERLIKTIQPPKGIDIDGTTALKWNERREQDLVSLKRYVKDGGKDVISFAQQLHKTELSYLQSGNTDDEITYFIPTYPNKSSMEDAIKNGANIPQDVFDRHIRYFKAGTPPPKPQKNK